MSILEYLKEREEYFYPEEETEEQEDSIDVEDDYGLDFVDDEDFSADHIEVEDIPDNSDPILNADEFMPNSEIQDIYSRGKGFDLTDNQDLYEVVKLVKDMTDKHRYMRDLTWKVSISNRNAKFTFKVDNDSKDDFFLKGVQQYVVQEMFKKFGPVYEVKVHYSKSNDETHNVMTMNVKLKEDEERKDLRQISFHTPASNSFAGQRSPISKM